jgi:hypothetical protein
LGRAALATAGIATALALSAASGTANAYSAGGHARSPVATEAEANRPGISRGRIHVRPPARPRANVSARIGLRPPARNQPRDETQAATAIAFPPLFGSPEVRSSNIGLFPKWTGALERAAGARRNVDPARIRLQISRDEAQKGGLAGAVAPHQPDLGARGHGQPGRERRLQ